MKLLNEEFKKEQIKAERVLDNKTASEKEKLEAVKSLNKFHKEIYMANNALRFINDLDETLKRKIIKFYKETVKKREAVK